MSKQQPCARDEFTAEEFEQARRMYAAGHGVVAISVCLERSRKAVAQWVVGLERGALQKRGGEPWEIEAARRMRSEGARLYDIAREMRRSPGTVAYWIRDLPQPVRASCTRREQQHARRLEADRVRDEKRQRALELYRSGELSRGAIGRQVGVGVSTVTAWVTEAGLELRAFPSTKLGASGRLA